jgi:trans-2,3-dihydro-3-hydroxyanthranilate isomerase
MPSIAFVTVDVFTRERFAGNPLAVIPDARGLTAAQMQTVAAEFGYAETTFVLPPDDAAHTAGVRIFTPTMEVPFAGHPNVGTGFVLGRRSEVFGRPPGDRLRFEERAGVVEVALRHGDDGLVSGARIVAPQPLSVGPDIDAATVAACASLDPEDIDVVEHGPVRVSVGLPFAVARVRDLATLGRARPNVAAFHDADARYTVPGDQFSLFLYAPVDERPWRLRARMFAPLDNVIEDPATGSASAALGSYLVALRPEADGDTAIAIEQGVEMGRRSLIQVDVRKAGGAIRQVSVAGDCVAVMQGTIDV